MSSSEAPGRLELVRSFINTVEAEDELDLLASNGSLVEWCSDNGWTDGAALPEDQLAGLRRLREALRATIEANAGEGSPASAWQALESFVREVRFEIAVVAPAQLELRAAGRAQEAIAGSLLGAVYDAVADGTWRRLKACRKHSCRWAFYDRSKNGSGAWCSMRVCGNRVKAQRRRRREQQSKR